MTLLIAAILLQSPTVEERVAAFAKGDAAARESLLKLGPPALAALYKARDQAPEKIDALVLDIKKASAYPKLDKDPPILEVKCDVQFSDSTPEDIFSFLREFTGANLVCDRFEPADLKVARADVTMKGATVPQVLDQVCRTFGLDFGFFHNVTVIGKPERLWGQGKTAPVFGSPAVERQHRTPEDNETLNKLRRIKINLDFQGATVKVAADYMKEISEIPFEVEDPAGKPIPVLRIKDLNMADVCSLMSQIRDLDFIVQEGKVIIGPREVIAKKIAGKK